MTRRLRIAYVCFSSYGGSGVVATELARSMAARGHEVHVVASEAPHRLGRESGVELHTLSPAAYPLFEQPLYGLAVTSKLVELAQSRGLDLVHAHYAVPHAVSAYLAQQVLGARAPKVIITLHGTDVTRVGNTPPDRVVNGFAIRAAAGVTTPSRYLQQAACEAFALDAPHVEVIENFVDTAAFRPPFERDRSKLDVCFGPGADVGAPVLVHISNFRPVKRTADLVAVLARLRERRRARLLLVGDGPDRPAVEEAVRAHGLGANVAFVGASEDVAGYLAHADLFLLTSEMESFGLAALEAASCGLPVLAYAVGGLPEVVQHQETGVLIENRDVEALADAADELLADDRRRIAMGAAARRHVEARYGVGPAVDRYERYYARVVAAEGGA
ncbi:MAG: N-acetyl-alpha-D-glucosaminyl L-malate synthase BshA [Deltaproteobacteria bacterium]